MYNPVKKEIDLEKIINEMYQKYGQNGLTEFEKTRYLYIELGKLFRYDLNYLTYYDRKKEDIYYKTVDFDNIEDNAFTCVQMADIYIETLKRVGIKAVSQNDIRNTSGYEMSHKYAVVNLSDGRNFIADLIYDLPYIQLGMKTSNFGTNSEEGNKDILSDEEVKLIDDKIGYTCEFSENEKAYTEKFIELIQAEMNDPQKMKEYVASVYDGEEYKEENLIQYKLDLIKYFFGIQTMGFYEGSKIMAELYRGFFSEEERKKLSFTLFRREPHENHKIGNVEEIACYCFKKNENECEYYIYEEGKALEKISREEIKEKIKTYTCISSKNVNEEEFGDDIFVI